MDYSTIDWISINYKSLPNLLEEGHKKSETAALGAISGMNGES